MRATAAAFRRIAPLTGTLLLPYLAWLTSAAALDLTLWRMNPVRSR